MVGRRVNFGRAIMMEGALIRSAIDPHRPPCVTVSLRFLLYTSTALLWCQPSCAMSSKPEPPVPAPLAPPQPAISPNCNLAHLNPLPPSVFTLPQTAQLEALYTIIRDKETSRGDFLFYSDRIIRLLVEEGLNHLPVVARTVETPTVSF
jgi:hypothetical protein